MLKSFILRYFYTIVSNKEIEIFSTFLVIVLLLLNYIVISKPVYYCV